VLCRFTIWFPSRLCESLWERNGITIAILTLLVTTSDLMGPAKKEAEQVRVEYWHGGVIEQKLKVDTVNHTISGAKNMVNGSKGSFINNEIYSYKLRQFHWISIYFHSRNPINTSANAEGNRSKSQNRVHLVRDAFFRS